MEWKRGRRHALELAAAGVMIAATTLGCGGPVEAPRSVERHEAIVEVNQDGSILLTERLEGSLFVEDGIFQRVVSGDRADAIDYVGSSTDGLTWTAHDFKSLQVVVERGRVLQVTWRWTGTSAPPTSLHWRYHLTGATGLREQRGVLQWPVLASQRGMSVAVSRIELRLPAGVPILRGTGIAETGWTVEPLPNGMVATRVDLGLEPATLLAEYPVDLSRVSLPEWQVNDDLQGEFAPAFVSAALFMVVIGVGVVWIVRFEHPTIRPRDTGPAVIPLSLSAEAIRSLHRGTSQSVRAVTRELTDARLIDANRLAVSRGLHTTAWVGTLVALFCAVAGHFVLWRFGWWPHIVPVSMIGVALLFLMFSRWFRVLTLDGERLRAALRRR